MRNFTHRWPQSGHSFSKLGYFFPVFEKVLGRTLPPYPPLVTRLVHGNSFSIYCSGEVFLFLWLFVMKGAVGCIVTSCKKVKRQICSRSCQIYLENTLLIVSARVMKNISISIWPICGAGPNILDILKSAQRLVQNNLQYFLKEAPLALIKKPIIIN